MKKVVFVGVNGSIPSGGSPGAWTVGKIYDLAWGEPGDGSLGVVSDNNGKDNAWSGRYFVEPEKYVPHREQKAEDAYNVLKFLYHRRKEVPNDLWGGVRIDEAFESALRLTGLTKEDAERIFG